MFIKDLFFQNKLFQVGAIVILVLIIGYQIPLFFIVGKISALILLAFVAYDGALLFLTKRGIHAVRFTPDKLSNGDDNEVRIFLESRYNFPVTLVVIDEVPAQFQKRDSSFQVDFKERDKKSIRYQLKPVKRGEYEFGMVRVFVSTKVGLVRRRFSFDAVQMVPVYPSYLQMAKYEIMAISNRLFEMGIKKIRKLGHNMEFEQIKDYVPGDDFRTINWKATARVGHLMTNTYQDERSQQIFCLIDKGRAMRLPFDGMTLMDYAINASLVLCNVALNKDDKAGLLTFNHRIGTLLPARKRKNQMSVILETLYNQKTAFRESDISRVFAAVKTQITQRSLLVLFTNFETISGMERQLPYLRKITRSHVLITVFFENTELADLIEEDSTTVRDIYQKAIAENYVLEKKMIAKKLNNYGIYTILTTPENLTVDTVNRYLELKSRGII